MHNSSDYPYIRDHILEERNTYFFSRFGGEDLLSAWYRSREDALRDSPQTDRIFSYFDETIQNMPSPNQDGLYRCSELLAFLWNMLPEEGDSPALPLLDRILQRFEVSKRIFCHYGAEISAKGRTDYHDLSHYLAFALVLGRVANRNLKYLNALLKVNDILCSVYKNLSPEEMIVAKDSFETEMILVKKLVDQKCIL